MIKTIYINSKGKPETVSIIHWFRKYNFKNFVIVVCADDNIEVYQKNYACGVIATPVNIKTLAMKKEWIINKFSKPGEWLLTMDDNITSVTGILKPQGEYPREQYAEEISPQQLLKQVNEDIKIAEHNGAVLGGYGNNDNYFFRKKKYRTVGFVWGKIAYYKNVGIEWPHTIKEMDDYAITALSLQHSGRVIINNYLYPIAKRYEKIGGTGTYEKRIPNKRAAAKYLVETFKGMFRYVERSNLDALSEVRMRFTSEKQIDIWRSTVAKPKGYVRT